LPLPLPLLLELGFFLFRDCFFLPILLLVRRYYKYIYMFDVSLEFASCDVFGGGGSAFAISSVPKIISHFQ
jgi:hypothetical protein